MIVRTGSLVDRIIMNLPLALGQYEHARVGTDIESFRRFTPKLRWVWGRRSPDAVVDDDPIFCYACEEFIELGEQSVETYVDCSDPETGPLAGDLIEVIVHKRCYGAFLRNG